LLKDNMQCPVYTVKFLTIHHSPTNFLLTYA
jgi:hypothetical protein